MADDGFVDGFATQEEQRRVVVHCEDEFAAAAVEDRDFRVKK